MLIPQNIIECHVAMLKAAGGQLVQKTKLIKSDGIVLLMLVMSETRFTTDYRNILTNILLFSLEFMEQKIRKFDTQKATKVSYQENHFETQTRRRI